MEEDTISVSVHQIRVIYFSPTGGTKTVATHLADRFADRLGLPVSEIDFTAPSEREECIRFGGDELVVMASPVYAGRLPNKIMPDFKRCFSAEGAIAVPVVVYGNRSYGGALTEFRWILQEAGFRVIAGAAFVSRHAFSDEVGCGRPDEDDREEIYAFADGIAQRLQHVPLPEYDSENMPDPRELLESIMLAPVSEDEIPPYYTPLKEDGTPARFLKAKPQTDPDKCIRCGICRGACPMGSINGDMQAEGICIKCQACVRKCPMQAKRFTDEDFLSHVRMLERDYRSRNENVALFASLC